MDRRRVTAEDGVGLVEVLVSVLILVAGLLGLVTAFNGSSHLNTTVQRQNVATDQAEAAMEAMKRLDYDSLWLKTPLPTNTTDGNSPASDVPTNPNYWVGTGANAGKLRIPVDFSSESSGTSSPYETLFGNVSGTSTGTGIDPGPTTYTSTASSGYTVNIYRYITSVDEPCLNGTSTGAAKRLVVAAVLSSTTTAGAKKPVWLTSLVPKPTASACA